MRIKPRYHKIDGWRGYWMPGNAIVGCSDTGNWADSPCRTADGKVEMALFRKRVLRPAGIKSHCRYGTSSNVFCAKRWLLVDPKDFAEAVRLTRIHMESQDWREYRLLHDANLEDVPDEAKEAA